MWPPAPAYGVSPLKDETLGGKYKLKKGTFVTVLVMALHRDPSVWGPHPDVFDPENFSREAEAKRPANAWKPFGNGQRACIGRGFAMHEAALALGMILQRFKLLDHTRYQMHLKETLTIKPDGFKIKVRARSDNDRTIVANRPGATAAAASSGATAPARVRPGHNTPLLILYGSNLGTAEDLAHRVADLAEVNGFATKLAPLDDYVGNLKDQGGVIIFCASYNGAPPDNATKFVKWLESDLPKDAFDGVRYAVFGCGNSDWLATYQSIPRLIDERLAAHGAATACPRGEGDARDDLDGQFEKWFTSLRAIAVEEFGVNTGFSREANDEPLYKIEPVAHSAVNTVTVSGGQFLSKFSSTTNCRTNPAPIRPRVRPGISRSKCRENVTYSVGDHLSVIPRNDPVLVDASRGGSVSCLQIRCGCRSLLAVGRNCPSTMPSLSGGC